MATLGGFGAGNPDWFDQNGPDVTDQAPDTTPQPAPATPAPAAPASAPSGPSDPFVPSGNTPPAYLRIYQLWQAAGVKNPTIQQVTQWGTDIDPTYFVKIQQAINSSVKGGATPAATPSSTTPSSTAPRATGGGSLMDQFNAILAKHPGDPQAAIDEFNSLGIDDGSLKPAWYPGSKTIGLANGTYLVEPGTGGNSGTGWQVVQRGDESGGGSSTGSAMSQFNLTPAPTYQPAKLPTQAEVEATPGFQFTLGQGQQAIDRKNAATGTYLSGGADKEQAQYATGLADQYYQQAVNNALNVNQMNNQGALQNWEAQNGLGLSAFGANLGAQNQFWNQGFQENVNAFNQYNQNQQAAFLQWLALANLGNPGNPYA